MSLKRVSNLTCAVLLMTAGLAWADDVRITFTGTSGPGLGKQIVLIAGDEEYRSEEGLPQLGKILAARHGFTCTVLFAINPADGTIDPQYQTNIPGMDALKTADLAILLLRYRNLPEAQMKPFLDYLDAGKPLIGLRTATHAFKFPKDSPFYKYSCDSREPGWEGGFGRKYLGETWINHHGAHKKESTRGVIAPGAEGDPILRGCEDIWGSTDVYGVRLPLPEGCRPLVLGQVLEGMAPTDKPLAGPKNDPMMPIAWTKTYEGAGGKKGRVFTTTMGAATDLESEGLRRLIVNATFWCLGMESQIPARAEVGIVGKYKPSAYGFNGEKKGLKPVDLGGK